MFTALGSTSHKLLYICMQNGLEPYITNFDLLSWGVGVVEKLITHNQRLQKICQTSNSIIYVQNNVHFLLETATHEVIASVLQVIVGASTCLL